MLKNSFLIFEFFVILIIQIVFYNFSFSVGDYILSMVARSSGGAPGHVIKKDG